MSFHWLKRTMPRSLYGRAALILLLPVLSLQLIVSVVFIQRHFEGVTRQMTSGVLLEMDYLREEIAEAPDRAAARAVAREIGEALELEVSWPESAPPEDYRQWYDFSGIVVTQLMRDELEDVLAVDLPDDSTAELWLGSSYGPMRVHFDRDRVSASNPHQLLVIMVVLGGLMTAIAFVYLRNQLRPITRMAAAAEAFGKGRIVPYSPSGAVEVRSAGHAFLEMRGRIERQTQSRTMMLSGISHDLRTPLTRMRLGLSMLDDAEAEPLLRDVEDMERLIDAFLDFARGNAEDETEVCDLLTLVRDRVAEMRRGGAAAELAEVSAEAEGTLVPLRPVAVGRALDNLIGNALRYGSLARVSVTVSKRSVRIAVEDDGPGIPAHQREEAMRPFSRLDPARNQDRGSGVGLGLAIVADVARAHGGRLALGESVDLGGLKAELVLAR